MSDQSKFINTYIDTTIATLHEYMGSSLQLKTQLKLSNDTILEKDGLIAQLANEIENLKSINSTNINQSTSLQAELAECRNRMAAADDSNNAMSSKLSHMDNILKQLSDTNQIVSAKDGEIASLTNELNGRDERISALNEEIANLKITIKTVSKPEKIEPAPKELPVVNTAKVQLNTKNKPKAPNDDF
jgi:chromosome segregation ATPase